MIAIGALALAASTAGLFLLFEPALSWYYQLAWWSYVVLADGLNRRLAGRSLIRDRPREFLWMAVLSVAWWCVFELVNLRLGNWYYVMSHAREPERWVTGILAFATVLPGIVETLELVENLGFVRHSPAPRLRWTRGREATCLAGGVLFFALPLLWPDAFFHLTWGSFALLIEPWNRRHAPASFLRDLEAGEAGPLVRTLLAGLACGLLWELWNYWARSKWIYTVPGFDQWKLFEMPLMGFLGFPPFAVECLVVVRFARALADRARARGPRTARALAYGSLAAAAAVTIAAFMASDVTVDSRYAPVSRMEAIPAHARERLSALGLRSPERLVRALRTARAREEWSRRSGLTAVELEAACESAELVLHKGLGDVRARELAALGVRRREDLARWTPAGLAAALRARGPSAHDRFLERRARVWIGG